MKRLLAISAALLAVTACGPGRAGEPKVISYGHGAELRNGSDVGKLTGAPDDFKQYIAGVADATGAGSDPTDKCAPRIFVDRIDTSGYAKGGVFDCGGAQLMWARRQGGLWRQIWGGQITPDCPTMRKYRVPRSIAGKTCWDVKLQKDIAYPG
ncbi:MAG: hypothetical protein ACJ71Z_13165 [Aeromicrobium sp.]